MCANLPSMPARRSQHRPRPDDHSGQHLVDSGTASIVSTSSNGGTWLVVVNGVMSSSVHPDHPERLDFEYMQWFGAVLDELAPPGDPMTVVHLGGAGCTMAQYVAATRPASRQHVFEIDGALVTLARQAFGLRRLRKVRITTADAREGIARLADESVDVVIRDAFAGETVPAHLTTVEFMQEVRRVLRPTGTYLSNVADTSDVRHSRVEAAVALDQFPHVSLIAEPAQLRKRRFGNVVLSASGVELPDDALVRRLAGGMVRARYVETGAVRDMVAGTRPLRDADLVAP
jgi:spermidine synthase